MRKLVGALLLVAVPLHLIYGALFVLSSRYRAIAAEIESQDLSAVAGDLAGPEELARERRAADQRLAGGRGGAQLAVGIALLVSALLQLAGGILALLGRGRFLVVGVALISLAAATGALAVGGFNFLGLGCIVPLVLAAALALMGKGWAKGREQPARAQPEEAP